MSVPFVFLIALGFIPSFVAVRIVFETKYAKSKINLDKNLKNTKKHHRLTNPSEHIGEHFNTHIAPHFVEILKVGEIHNYGWQIFRFACRARANIFIILSAQLILIYSYIYIRFFVCMSEEFEQ